MDLSIFVNAVAEAARRPQVAAAVAQVYEQLQRRIDQRRPRCELSGRCCRFDEYGHRLYVTTLEMAAFLAALRSAGRALPASAAGAGCPFQSGNLCTVHIIRPFGCRVFFCDTTAQQWQQEQYEHFHGEIKRLHERLEVPYFYVEWRAALDALAGRIDPPGSVAPASPAP